MASKITCQQCQKTFRTESGLNWHLEHVHGQVQQSVTLHQPSEQVQAPTNDLEQRVNEKLAELERKLEALAANGEHIPEHSHPHSHSKPSELEDLIKAVCGYEAPYLVSVGKASLFKRVAELEQYSDILRDLKLAVERERAKHNAGICTASVTRCFGSK